VPLKAKLKLYCTDPDHEDFDTVIQDVYLGPIPYMTDKGTFVINGAERVVVSQLHRSPGVFFGQSTHANGTKLYSARIIPFRGSWIEFATDINNVMHAYIDRKKKLPVTTLLRAIGLESDKDIIEIFGLAEEVKVTKTNLKKSVGRKLAARVLKTWNEDFVDQDTGEVTTIERNEVLLDRETELDESHIDDILESGVTSILLHKEDVNASDYSIIFNTLQKDPTNSEKEAIQYIYRQLRNAEPPDDASAREVIQNLFFSEKRYDLGEVGRYRVNKKLDLGTPMEVRVLTKEDIIAIIKYLIELINSKTDVDDIDHLSNRRVRTVGEQLYNQFAVGLARMSRTIRERMNVRDNETFTPIDLINAKTISSVINTFFGTNALSQFMDQTNPLAEITHKRRLSALGPGGLSRERAGFEVRDVHYTHYGRLCPIETPEGPNIGLISYLACYSRLNEYGFIEAPYRKVDKQTGIVTDEVVYMTADVEDNYVVAQANEPLDEQGRFVNQRVTCRCRDEFLTLPPERVDYMDVSPKMVVSVATAMIPFLENDDANRALMGANMQRQAVPLLKTEAPVVGTGMEYKAAYDSGVVVIAKRGGTVVALDGTTIEIKTKSGEIDKYELIKFAGSNQGTCINQRPIVSLHQEVADGQVIADGPATNNGEISLGKNALIGFMTWEGYNYEDAVLINEKIVRDDVYTSIHIIEHEVESRDTKLGPEEITRDIPNVGEDALKDLDEDGIIRVGAEVRSGDILVGKVTPKGETELTSEERLLRAIFGEKAREVRDTSMKVPHGEYGIVVDVKVFTRANSDELSPGVNKVVRVYIAQKRKIQAGDKMAGRHGNKGVVSRVLPQEDMPFLPDGRPLDIVLNPLGVPSRMNIGQVLEVHLGYAAMALGWKMMTPVFDGAHEDDIRDCLKLADIGYYVDKNGNKIYDGKVQLTDGRTGEKFDNRVTVGYMYYLKLHHLVDDKIHARSTGPYSLVTQQPLGGKAQFGGQRFGEMEVWALEAYGAAYTLQEIITVKSDDVVGRVKTYEAIVKGENIPTAGTPEAFKVLFKELQALGLDTKLYDKSGNEVELKQDIDDDGIQPVATADDDKAFTMVNDYEGQEGYGLLDADGEAEEANQDEDVSDDDIFASFNELFSEGLLEDED
jgi:DNA-directed RNA polymerase subunit beta